MLSSTFRADVLPLPQMINARSPSGTHHSESARTATAQSNQDHYHSTFSCSRSLRAMSTCVCCGRRIYHSAFSCKDRYGPPNKCSLVDDATCTTASSVAKDRSGLGGSRVMRRPMPTACSVAPWPDPVLRANVRPTACLVAKDRYGGRRPKSNHPRVLHGVWRAVPVG